MMIKADGSRRRFPLPDGPTTVGRKNSCGLRIPLTSVSRLHCEFRVEDGRVSLRDLGSSNGTFKNGQRIQDTDLVAGDQVEVGPVRFTLVIDGQPASAVGGGGGAAAAADPGDAAALSLEPGELDGAGEPLADASSDPDRADEADLDADDELAAAMASIGGDGDDGDDDDGIDLSRGPSPDDSSAFAFTLDDAEDGDDDAPVIELLDDDDKP